jgi:hypothetical protein
MVMDISIHRSACLRLLFTVPSCRHSYHGRHGLDICFERRRLPGAISWYRKTWPFPNQKSFAHASWRLTNFRIVRVGFSLMEVPRFPRTAVRLLVHRSDNTSHCYFIKSVHITYLPASIEAFVFASALSFNTCLLYTSFSRPPTP